jgi:hypothetical protein
VPRPATGVADADPVPKLFWYAVAALLVLLGVTLMLHGAHDSGLVLIAGLATAVLTRILRSHDAYRPPA